MATKKRTTKRGGALARIEEELPRTVREYTKDVQNLLGRLEKNINKFTATTQRQATRLLR